MAHSTPVQTRSSRQKYNSVYAKLGFLFITQSTGNKIQVYSLFITRLVAFRENFDPNGNLGHSVYAIECRIVESIFSLSKAYQYFDCSTLSQISALQLQFQSFR